MINLGPSLKRVFSFFILEKLFLSFHLSLSISFFLGKNNFLSFLVMELDLLGGYKCSMRYVYVYAL